MHRYTDPRKYQVTVTAKDGKGPRFEATIIVLPSPEEEEQTSRFKAMREIDWTLMAVSAVLATISGILVLYVGKSFGSLSDYLYALLWGFGLDGTLRGYAATFKQIGPGT